MEFLEFIVFNGKLYVVDDCIGVVFQIYDKYIIVWVILLDGDGMEVKGFKVEWMVVKGKIFYIGGFGKEWIFVEGVF